MKKFLPILFCLVTTLSFAQTAVVKGLIKDAVTQKLLDSATAVLSGTEFKSNVNADGVFMFTGVPYGRYTIEVKDATHDVYSQLIDVNKPEVVIGSIGLRVSPPKVEAVAEAATEREDNRDKVLADDVPTATLTEVDTKDLGDQSIAGAIGPSNDIFISTVAFVQSEAHFRIRGYNQDAFEVYMNGIPMNALSSGYALTSAWSGLNNVTHNRDITLGLAPSANAFGGPGGSYSLDTRASAQRAGLIVSYSNANREFRHRLMATYSTGLLKSGWAVTASFTRRWAKEGYVPGTTYDGFSYHFSVDKHFGSKDILSFTAYGSPTKQGVAEAETKEAYDLAGSHYYNYAWGYQNGVKRNGFVRRNFQPQFILNNEYKINAKSKLMTAVSFSFGKSKNPGLVYYNAPNPIPTYYKNMPSYITDPTQMALAQQLWSGDVNNHQINWDNIYDINRHSSDTVLNVNGIAGNNQRLNISRYVLVNRVDDAKRFNFNTVYNNDINEHISLTGGLRYQLERVEHYAEISDLLGGQYFIDINQYAPLTYPGNSSVAQNNLNAPQRLLTTGDKYDYDYVTVEHHATAWIQPNFHYKHIDFFVAAQAQLTSFYRDGLYRNGLFPDNSFGKSATHNFGNYAFKGGLTYKITNQHFLYANGAMYTQAPLLDDAYVSPEIRDQVAGNLSNEKVYSGEAGYVYKSPIIKLRASFFVTQFNNQTQTTSYFDYDLSTFVNNVLTGMNSRNIGGEIGLSAKVYKGFSVSAVGTLGKYIYTNRPKETVTDDNDATPLITDQTVYLKNFNVGNSPQLATTLGLSYHSPKQWFIDLYFNYYGENYVRVNPTRRTVDAISTLDPSSTTWQQIIDQEKLPGAFTMDMFAGYNWYINKQFPKIKKYKYYVALSLNVSNMTNNRNFITRGYEQLEFNSKTKNLVNFPNKYVYAYGANYLLTLSFRMQ